LDPTAKLKSMSKGMKQKTAIVSAFMAQSELLILDEPTTGLDPLMRDAFLSLVLEEKAKGHTIFMSSHIFSEMEETCDYVAFIKEGHLAQIIDVNELHHPSKATYRVRFALKGDYESFVKEKAFPLKDEDPKLLTLSVEVPLEKSQLLFQSLGKYHVTAFNEIKATLEACFDDIIAGGK
jgi:ABC-2 type transport system ATP-binding protein